MRSLLVTGAAGFVGANFVHFWMEHHARDRLVALDALTYAGNRQSLSALEQEERYHFVHGDICDIALVERLMVEHSIDTIVHFAAESHVDRSITGPDAFVQTNVVGSYTLLEAARRAWRGGTSAPRGARFHHVSTDEVYGSLGPDDAAFDERTAYAPNSPYSASKAASDHFVRAYHHTYGLDVTTSNSSNNYGPYQFPEKLIPLTITNALLGEALPVYGDGRNVRDWLYVEDHCRGIERVLLEGEAGETYNIGGNSERQNIDIVMLLCQLMDEAFANTRSLRERFSACPAARGDRCEKLISFVEDRPGHDRRYAINASKVEAELGFRPQVRFEEGLRATVDWYLNGEDWWRPLRPSARI